MPAQPVFLSIYNVSHRNAANDTSALLHVCLACIWQTLPMQLASFVPFCRWQSGEEAQSQRNGCSESPQGGVQMAASLQGRT